MVWRGGPLICGESHKRIRRSLLDANVRLIASQDGASKRLFSCRPLPPIRLSNEFLAAAPSNVYGVLGAHVCASRLGSQLPDLSHLGSALSAVRNLVCTRLQAERLSSRHIDVAST